MLNNFKERQDFCNDSSNRMAKGRDIRVPRIGINDQVILLMGADDLSLPARSPALAGRRQVILISEG
jgi:hypothetical protein